MIYSHRLCENTILIFQRVERVAAANCFDPLESFLMLLHYHRINKYNNSARFMRQYQINRHAKMAASFTSVALFLVLSVVSFVQSKGPDELAASRYKNESLSKDLRVIFADFKPYIHQKRNTHIYNGIEYLLVNTIAKQLNMSVSFQSMSREKLSYHWEPMSGYMAKLNFVF